MNGTDRCWAEVDLAALRHNAAVAIAHGGADVALLAVVKANGYGHGAVKVAEALHDQARVFGVASLGEALELRNGGITRPVMILGPAAPQERREIVAQGFIPSISNLDEATAFNDAAARKPVAINFVIDTGMGRMGTWQDEAVAELERIAALRLIQIHSVSTHLPVADEDAAFTQAELARFGEIVQQIRARVPGDYAVHVLLSAGILGFQQHRFDMMRAGLMLYGISPLPEFQRLLKPAMTLKTRVLLVRDIPTGRGISYGRTFITSHPMRVATLSVGYADGYPRSLSNGGASVLIGGRRCHVLGRITMDLIMVDVTEIRNIDAGDEVVLIGRQGDEEILASELAQRAGTIAWEIFTGIGSRVRRVYV
jgi:alanine racemase